MHPWVAKLRSLATKQPALFAFVSGYALVQLATGGWDLPSSFSWENDGIAPREMFADVASAFTTGQASRYPLLHQLLLVLLCVPITLPAAIAAGSFTPPELLANVMTVPLMTACTVVAKLVSIAMACASLVVLAKLCERIFGAGVGCLAAMFAATNLTVSYYGRTVNLDGPYLFWTTLAAHELLGVLDGHVRSYRKFAVFAAASVATKDQAYASYVLPISAVAIVVSLGCRGVLPRGRGHWRALVDGSVWGTLSYLGLSGVLFNPTGFVARVAELTGSASAHWRGYTRDPQGVLANLQDIVGAQDEYFWPWPFVIAAWLGVLIACVPKRGDDPAMSALVRRMLPLSFGCSSLVCFALVVGRSQHRFVLPMGFFLAPYVAYAISLATQFIRSRSLRRSVVVSLLGWSAWNDVQLRLTQLGDARHELERELATLSERATVETYGPLVYLPRFDRLGRDDLVFQRVGTEPTLRRNPIRGMHELQAPFEALEQRRPDVMVLTESFINRFEAPTPSPGRVSSEFARGARSDAETTKLFARAREGRLTGYHLHRTFETNLPNWAVALGARPHHVHGSTGMRVWMLVRITTTHE